jgi:hypothetical protein
MKEADLIPVAERVCFNCSKSVENEIHVILFCPLYDDLRATLLNECIIIDHVFNTFNDQHKRSFVLSHPGIVRKTAKILYLILERRKTFFY